MNRKSEGEREEREGKEIEGENSGERGRKER